jgi:calcineurin-like phosphoesterase family protein
LLGTSRENKLSTWFTADPHYGHDKIRTLCNRPFQSLDEMDRVMVQRHNDRVKKDDVVYFVGDFAFTANDFYLSQLNGVKILVPGNHDHEKRIKKARGWYHVAPPILEVTVDFTLVVLCHYGLRVWNRAHYGAIHMYGHSHGRLPGDSQSCDVGVDCWSFEPVSLDEVRARMLTHPKRVEPDHHKSVVNTQEVGDAARI